MHSIKTRLAALAILAALTGAATASGQIIEPEPEPEPPTPVDQYPGSCDNRTAKFHVKRAKSIIDRAYSHKRWKDKTPATAQNKRNWTNHRQCLEREEARLKIGQYRRKAAKDFREYRERKLRQLRRERFRQRYTPYYGGGRWWAIPWPVVSCESGGDFGAYNSAYEPHGPGSGPGGAYQIIRQTWQDNGGSGEARYASKRKQHKVAATIRSRSGLGPWECAG